MTIEEVPVDTPIVAQLKKEIEEGTKRKKDYYFTLEEEEMMAMRNVDLPPAAIVAYMAIKGACWAAKGKKWASLTHKTLEAFNFPQAWWRLNIRRLEDAGFIECSREPGKLRRFRVVPL